MSPDAEGDKVFISHADWDHCEQARKRGKSDFLWLRWREREGWKEGEENERERCMKERKVNKMQGKKKAWEDKREM